MKIWSLMMNVWYGGADDPDRWKLPPVPVEEVAFTSRPACVKLMRRYREEVPETDRKTYSCDIFKLKAVR